MQDVLLFATVVHALMKRLTSVRQWLGKPLNEVLEERTELLFNILPICRTNKTLFNSKLIRSQLFDNWIRLSNLLLFINLLSFCPKSESNIYHQVLKFIF